MVGKAENRRVGWSTARRKGEGGECKMRITSARQGGQGRGEHDKMSGEHGEDRRAGEGGRR